MTNRWQDAQKAELKDWKNNQVCDFELKEVEKKYKLFLKQLAETIKIGKRWKILDLGCGPTCISRYLPVSIKIGLEPLAGKLNLKNKLIAGVKILEGKAEKIPFNDKYFDLVICRNAIDHMETPQKAIKETSRVLKNKGYFILAVYVHPYPIALFKKLSEKIPFLKNIEHPFTFTIQSLKKLIQKDFILKKEFVIHTGYHPNDYGKVNEKVSKRTLLEKTAIFINFKVFREKWFVKEYCLLLRKK